MPKTSFTCKEVNLPHSEMLALRNAGLLNLGIENDVAVRIANIPGAGPRKTTATAAFHFWSWVAMGVFIYSIYLSFTASWWWFIPGTIVMSIIWSANKKGTSENLLDAAIIDQDFYERIRTAGGWLYEIEDSEAEKFKTQERDHSGIKAQKS